MIFIKKPIPKIHSGLWIIALLFCVPLNSKAVSGSGYFPYGVASGDPSKTEVVLWTRLTSPDRQDAEVQWEMSQDKSFAQIEQQGNAMAKSANDFCVKAFPGQLDPGTFYYYRFSYKNSYSTTGRTKTLPTSTERIKIGVVNCAKYTGGYYHAYEALSQMEGIDVVIHLGDYIYESAAAKEGDSYWPSVQATGRQHIPAHECLSLEDYRTRYAQYRSDTSLQKLHANFPMITIWDDHEIAMKPLKEMKDGKLEYDGNWEKRKNNSIIAYHEWLPLRPEPFENIYRSFQFGDLVNLMMLDTRVCCKSEVTKTLQSLEDTSRHIIGNEQLRWIENEVMRHDAEWNVFGNQLLYADKDMGWNRWSGFPADRDRLSDFIEGQPDKNFLFTTGNAHNPHHYVVFKKDKKDTLFHEVLPGSISSGNNAEKAFFDESILAKEEKRLKDAGNVLWFDQNSHGFIVLNATPEELKVDWYFVTDIRKKEFEVFIPYSIALKPH